MPVLIRSTAKAIILHEGRILLNRYADSRNGTYYALPGGGQNQFEPLGDAVVRECLEETGYRVRPVRLAAVCEEIWNDAERRQKYPEYAHRMLHIFLCTLDGTAPEHAPTEMDLNMLESVWVPLDALEGLTLEPAPLQGRIEDVLNGTAPLFLGTQQIG